jgi:hypothetical protein
MRLMKRVIIAQLARGTDSISARRNSRRAREKLHQILHDGATQDEDSGRRRGLRIPRLAKARDRDYPAGIRAFQAYPWKTLGRGEIRLTAVPGRILTGTGVKHLLSHACTPQ